MKDTALQIALQLAARHSEATGRPKFHAETVAERGALYIYDVIGQNWFGDGLTAKTVQAAIEGMKGAKALDIYVNSPGGDVFEAKAIFAQIRRFEGERVVHVDGIAASAATYIAMAGDKIITAPGATWMIHEVGTFAGRTAADLRAVADVLDMENKTYAETYAKRTGRTVEEILGWMNAETWMNATEAKERGFTDEIAEASESTEDLAALTEMLTTLRGHAV